MPATLYGSIALQVAMLLSNQLDLSTPIDKLIPKFQFDLINGVGADQADRIFHDTRSIAASTNDDLDLTGGTALLDPLGVAFSIARLKAAIFYARKTNASIVTIGASAAAPVLWFGANTHTEKLSAGQLHCHVAPDATGWLLTATTADVVRLANGAGGTALVDVVLIGASS